MTAEVRDQANRVLAVQTSAGDWKCAVCPTALQPTVNGDITDGVRAHWKTVHSERNVR